MAEICRQCKNQLVLAKGECEICGFVPVEEEKKGIHSSECQAQPSFASGSVADEIKKLAELRNSGVLSSIEFQQQKTRLLGVAPIICRTCGKEISPIDHGCINCAVPEPVLVSRPIKPGYCLTGCLSVPIFILYFWVFFGSSWMYKKPLQSTFEKVATPEESPAYIIRQKAEKEKEKEKERKKNEMRESEKNGLVIKNLLLEMRSIKGLGDFVQEIYFDIVVRIVVKNPWHSLIYQNRLQMAQGLRLMIKRAGGSGQFTLFDLMRNEVGGCTFFSGVWVQEK